MLLKTINTVAFPILLFGVIIAVWSYCCPNDSWVPAPDGNME